MSNLDQFVSEVAPPDWAREAFADVAAELSLAVLAYPKPMASPHEGYAVILEELDELWALVKVKQSAQDLGAMRREACQVAAMALRFMIDLCPPK